MWLNKLKTTDNWRIWLCFCFSILFLPLFPALGALGLAIVLVSLWCQSYRSMLRDPLTGSLGLLTSLLIIGTVLAEYPSEAWLGLANFLPYFALFIALKYLITRPSQLRILSWLLVLPSLPIVILGWGQMYLAWHTPELVRTVFGWDLIAGGIPPGRMSAVFIYANFLAIYLAIAFALALGQWLTTWQQKSPRRWFNLGLLSAILVADLSGLILTSSRNAWVLAVISVMAYALYLGWQWIVWSVTGAAISVFWASFVPEWGGTQLRHIVPAFIWQRLSDGSYERPVETLRLTQWQFCWDLIKQRPLFGWGLRNFTPLYELKTDLWLGHPHNLLLMFGAEAGIIALLCLLAIVGWIMFRAVVLLSQDLKGESKLIFFSYLVAFSNCMLFNLADVTIFDLRVNLIGWILLSAIAGVVGYSRNLDSRSQFPAIDYRKSKSR